MWDIEPVLYWRVRQNGKYTWQKAKACRIDRVTYAIESPVPKVIEGGDESE